MTACVCVCWPMSLFLVEYERREKPARCEGGIRKDAYETCMHVRVRYTVQVLSPFSSPLGEPTEMEVVSGLKYMPQICSRKRASVPYLYSYIFHILYLLYKITNTVLSHKYTCNHSILQPCIVHTIQVLDRLSVFGLSSRPGVGYKWGFVRWALMNIPQ